MPDDKEEVISPEEAEVSALFADYDSKIAEVQAQIDAINDPKLAPRPKPSFLRNEFTPKAETKTHLENKISILEKQAKGRAAEIAAKSQPVIKGKIYEKAEIWRNKEEASKDPKKQADKSFSYIGRLRERGKFEEQQKDFDTTKERIGAPFAGNKLDATVKPSNYYSHLHFNDIDNSRLPELDKVVDLPEPDRED